MSHVGGALAGGQGESLEYGEVWDRHDRRRESRCLQVCLCREPQHSEPPDADPHVRWCGRGVAGLTGYPLSRLLREIVPTGVGLGLFLLVRLLLCRLCTLIPVLLSF